jgi:Ca2+-binding EF-hand superfamily protein
MLASLAISAANSASQMLASLLSQITGSNSSSSSTTSASTDTSASSTPACSGTGMTGSTQGSLSGDVLMTLMQMQQQSSDTSSAASSSSSATSTASASTLASSDPLQQLFSAMDTNGDGSVSQSEMESYIEGVGGTQAQADSLYSALSQSGSSTNASTTSTAGITESQMSSALSQAQQAHGGGHHHHHKAGGSTDQADSAANTLLQALDTNDDGSVSQDELTSFVTANGGTSADASSDFAALDTSGSGSLTSADFAKAWSNLQAQQTSQSSGTMVVSLLDAFSKANTAASTSTTSISA